MKKKMVYVLCAALLSAGLSGCSLNQQPDEEQQSADDSAETGEDIRQEEETLEEMPPTEAKCTEAGGSGFVATEKYLAFYSPYGSSDGVFRIADTTDVYKKYFQKEQSVDGIMGTSEKIYYASDGSIYSYSEEEGEQLVYSGASGFARFIGMIDGVIYYETMSDDPSVGETKIESYDPESGNEKEFALESGWGNVDAVITGDHLFYRGGTTDPSATPLYELDLESGSSVQLEDYISCIAPDEAGKIYFTSYTSSDSLNGNVTIKSYDVVTGEKEEVFKSEENPGTIVNADSDGLFFELYMDGHALSRLDLATGELEEIGGGELYYIPDCAENTFYCARYLPDPDSSVTESYVYEYNENAGAESGFEHLELAAYTDYGRAEGMGYGMIAVYQEETMGGGITQGYGVVPPSASAD